MYKRQALFPRAHLLRFFQFAETHFCFKFNTIKTEPSVHREPAKGGKAFIIQRIPFAFSPSSEIYFLLKRTLCNFCPMPRINGRQRFDAAYADQTACISVSYTHLKKPLPVGLKATSGKGSCKLCEKGALNRNISDVCTGGKTLGCLWHESGPVSL